MKQLVDAASTTPPCSIANHDKTENNNNNNNNNHKQLYGFILALNKTAIAICYQNDNSNSVTVTELAPPKDTKEEGLEVQAVCCQFIVTASSSSGMDKSKSKKPYLLCAVSRYDKTISLYVVDPEPQKQQQQGEHGKKQDPFVVHACAKRVNHVALTSLAAQAAAAADNSSLLEEMIVVAGDLAGDVTAYPIPFKKPDMFDMPVREEAETNGKEDAEHNHATQEDNNENAKTATDQDKHDKNTKKSKPKSKCRLLLGHTGSIMTGLSILPCLPNQNQNQNQTQNQNQNRRIIITADRDEKIRISYFPSSFMIYGYLLGHTAFISSMDAALVSTRNHKDDDDEQQNEKECRRGICVTASGDGTVRLWDSTECTLLCSLDMSTVVKQPMEASNGENTDTDSHNLNNHNNNNNNKEETAKQETSHDDPSRSNTIKSETQDQAAKPSTKKDNPSSKDTPPSSSSSSSCNGTSQSNQVLLPSHVSLRSDGTLAAVVCHGSNSIYLLRVTLGSSSTTDQGGGQGQTPARAGGSLEVVQRLTCPVPPLAVKFLPHNNNNNSNNNNNNNKEGVLCVVLSHDVYFQQYAPSPQDPSQYTLQPKDAVQQAIQTYAAMDESSILIKPMETPFQGAKNGSGGAAAGVGVGVTLDGYAKQNASRPRQNSNFVAYPNWNDVGKKERSRMSEKKRRKRRRKGGGGGGEEEVDGNGGEGGETKQQQQQEEETDMVDA